MKKVKQVWYSDSTEGVGGHYSTGLILELEDGTFVRHQSTDPVMPFEKFAPSLPTNKEGN